MTLRSVFRQAVSVSIDQAISVVASQKRTAMQPAPQPVIDITDDTKWAAAGDLTEDFDQKLSDFMDFEDVGASRQWLLGE